jgi:hypothetical protein
MANFLVHHRSKCRRHADISPERRCLQNISPRRWCGPAYRLRAGPQERGVVFIHAKVRIFFEDAMANKRVRYSCGYFHGCFSMWNMRTYDKNWVNRCMPAAC